MLRLLLVLARWINRDRESQRDNKRQGLMRIVDGGVVAATRVAPVAPVAPEISPLLVPASNWSAP